MDDCAYHEMDADEAETRVNLRLSVTDGVSDETLRALASRGGLAALLEALTDYWKAAEADGLTDDPTDDADASIGAYGDGKPLAMTYGHIRRLQALLPQTGEGEPTPTPISDTDRVIADIASERRRQVGGLGWTSENDDKYVSGELACAAASYTLNDARYWPWGYPFRPAGIRRNLVKAGALIVAEIERLDRAEALSKSEEG